MKWLKDVVTFDVIDWWNVFLKWLLMKLLDEVSL